MNLIEAQEWIQTITHYLLENTPSKEIQQAMRMAQLALEKQGDLSNMINDMMADFKEEDTYSATLVMELLTEVSVMKDEYRKEIGLEV